jgi:hypothetical protein
MSAGVGHCGGRVGEPNHLGVGDSGVVHLPIGHFLDL